MGVGRIIEWREQSGFELVARWRTQVGGHSLQVVGVTRKDFEHQSTQVHYKSGKVVERRREAFKRRGQIFHGRQLAREIAGERHSEIAQHRHTVAEHVLADAWHDFARSRARRITRRRHVRRRLR